MGFILFVFALCFLFWIFEDIIFYRSDKKHNELQKYSIQWLDAVTRGEMNIALKTAKNICTNIPKPKQAQCVIELFLKNRISPNFINTGYNEWDFLYWRNALFFSILAKSLTECVKNKDNEDELVDTLFNAVHSCIKPVSIPKGSIPWPSTIWYLKKGLCDRQAWLLSELAYQLGFETQIVYLRNPETKVSPHTICEVRKGNQVWTADPFTGILLKNISVSDLCDNLELKKNIWPDRPDWQVAINDPIFFTPSYPQAYAPRNQILYSRLQSMLGEYCPRFGESPFERQEKYLVLAANQKNKFTYKFWFYPFRLLYAEMVITSRQMK